MSNFRETRYRLLLGHLNELADQLINEEPIAPAALEEQTVRLLAGCSHGAAATPCQQVGPAPILRVDEVDMAALAETAAVHGVSQS